MNKPEKNQNTIKNTGWPIWLLIGGLIGFGVVITFRDYRIWTRDETGKFGQGWGDMDKPASALNKVYLNREMGLRIAIPEEWGIRTKPGAETFGGIRFTQAAELGDYLTIWQGESGENLTDVTDRRAEELKDQGLGLKEREYIRGEKRDLTILEWTAELPGGKSEVRQEVWTKRQNSFVVMRMTIDESRWPEWKKTIRAVYENLEMVY